MIRKEEMRNEKRKEISLREDKLIYQTMM